jgi:hypothetical protein
MNESYSEECAQSAARDESKYSIYYAVRHIIIMEITTETACEFIASSQHYSAPTMGTIER